MMRAYEDQRWTLAGMSMFYLQSKCVSLSFRKLLLLTLFVVEMGYVMICENLYVKLLSSFFLIL